MVVAKEEVPVTVRDPPTLVFPVTVSVEAVVVAKLVVPVAVKLPVVRFDVLAFERLV